MVFMLSVLSQLMADVSFYSFENTCILFESPFHVELNAHYPANSVYYSICKL